MTPRSWTLAAAVSLAAIAVSLPRASAPARFRDGWSRDVAIQRARAAAAQTGLDTSAWDVRVSARHSLEDRLRFERLPAHPLRAVLSPLVYQVLFREPATSRRLQIDLYESGRVAYVKLARGQPLDAGKVFTLLAGPSPGDFVSQPAEKDKTELRWRQETSGRPELEARIRVDPQEGGALEAWLEPQFGKGYDDGNPAGRAWLVAAKVIVSLFALAAGAAAIFRTLRFVRRRDHLRFALAPVLLYLAVLAVYALSGQGGTRFGWGIRGNPWDSGDFFGTFFGRPWTILLPLAAGFTWARGVETPRWTGAILAATGRLFARRTGRELCAGFAAGCVIAAVSCLALAFNVPSNTTPQPLLDRWPLLASASRFVTPHAMLLFVLTWAFPLLERRPRKRWWWGTLSWGAGLLACSAGAEPMELAGWFALPFALVFWAVYRFVYLQQGLLAALAAAAFSDALKYTALALNGGNTLPGAVSFAVLFLASAAAVHVARKGRAIDEAEIAAELDRRNTPSARDLLSEREMLLGEFAEARSAQQALLPAHPPQIDGYSLAAACIPAREVGGDLYDFLPFPGGRWGLCVADVSGKGVPASLYMTLLKGMLLAESSQGASLDSIALAVNERLLAAGRRKTFVTLVVGLLDPAEASLDLLRAGHNPPLLRRASGECRFIQPAGLGLGLASNRLFGRTFRRESIQLDAGDWIVLYSDGLTEAMNPQRELYGEDRLRDAVQRAATLDAPQLLAAVLEDLRIFRAGADPHDDLTLLVVRKLEAAAPAALV